MDEVAAATIYRRFEYRRLEYRRNNAVQLEKESKKVYIEEVMEEYVYFDGST